jgi:pilus assembly protein CpaF
MQFDDSAKVFKSPEEEREVMTEKITTCFKQAVFAANLSFSRQESNELIEQLAYEVCGLGAIQKLLDREDITEVMVNGPDRIFIELKGKLVLSDVRFKDNGAVMHVIQKIVVPLGRRCDESSPLVDARLKDGSRVNAIIPPLALCGPTITIRKFSDDPFTIWNLADFGTLTKQMAEFINACILIKLNMVVSGGTGSGKTTTLNAISGFIPPEERIITVEDAAELQLLQDHVISLETRPPNVEGKGAVHIRDLVRNSLRMNPDRIIVGECRGGEALDMLSAMNTGNDGSLTTGHANSPKDMVSRLETMVMMSGMDLPSRVIREQIASAINIFIQQNRLQDGSRKITHITEISGIDDEGLVEINNIFEWRQEGLDENGKVIGALVPTGFVPTFMLKFKEERVDLPDGLFGEGFNVEKVYKELEIQRAKDLEVVRLEMIERSKKYAAECGETMTAKDKASLASRKVFHYAENEVIPVSKRDKKDTPKEEHGLLAGRKSLKNLRQQSADVPNANEEKMEKIRALMFKTMSSAAQYEDFPTVFETEQHEKDFYEKKLREAYTLIDGQFHYNLQRNTINELLKESVDNIVGFGVIQQLLDVEDITEIMVNGPDHIFIELRGKLTLSDVKFKDNAAVMQVISKIITPLGRRCDASSPLVDARLPDGSRVNAIIPPLALCGPTITIRKFAEDPFQISDLIGFGTMTDAMGAFINACILIKLNMVVSGGTGSGKTTTLNAISGFIPPAERIVTIEDAAELQLLQDHVVALETRPANVEGKGAVSIRELVRNSLRMNPDRIIVGECRGGEALDMLSAMNTGNDGSLTTGHANSPKDMVSRLETMVMMSGMDLPSRVIREQIASAVDLIVQQNRLQDGSRKITHVTEIRGMDDEGLVDIRNIFEWQQHGLDENGKVIGDLVPTGEVPAFLLRFKEENIPIPDGIFGEGFDLKAAYKKLEIQAKERAARQLERARARSKGLTPPIAYDDELKLREWLQNGKISAKDFDAVMASGKMISKYDAEKGTGMYSDVNEGTNQAPIPPAPSKPGLPELPPVPETLGSFNEHMAGTNASVLQLGNGQQPKPEDFDSFSHYQSAQIKSHRLALPSETEEAIGSTDMDLHIPGIASPVTEALTQAQNQTQTSERTESEAVSHGSSSNLRAKLAGIAKPSGNLTGWLQRRINNGNSNESVEQIPAIEPDSSHESQPPMRETVPKVSGAIDLLKQRLQRSEPPLEPVQQPQLQRPQQPPLPQQPQLQRPQQPPLPQQPQLQRPQQPPLPQQPQLQRPQQPPLPQQPQLQRPQQPPLPQQPQLQSPSPTEIGIDLNSTLQSTDNNDKQSTSNFTQRLRQKENQAPGANKSGLLSRLRKKE